MNQLTEKILHEIKEHHIAPKPRWRFLLQRWLVWVAAGFSVLLGSVAFSVMIFRLVNNDWEVLELLERSPLEHLIDTLPVVWLIVLVLFVALAYYNARHTSGAYKYHAYWLVLGSIIVSFSLGGVMYVFGLGPQVESFISQRIPFMQEIALQRMNTWAQPEYGLLAGEVLELGSGTQLFVIDGFDGEEWNVWSNGNVQYVPGFIPEEGAFVRVTGEVQNGEDYVFVADHVYPLFIGPGIRGGKLPHGHIERVGPGQFNIVLPRPVP